MKNLFILIIVIFFSLSVSAEGIGSGYGDKLRSFIGADKKKSTGNEVCLDDGTGVLKKVNRPAWEIGFRANLLDVPNGGDAQVRTENYDIILYHNLGTSNAMYLYASYGNRSITKNHFEGQEFEDDWNNQQIFGGMGIYLSPIITIYAGAGKILAVDEAGNESDIDTAIERGIAVDIPIFGNKLRLGYRAVDAPQKGDVNIEQSTGDAGFTALSINFIVGL